MRNWELVILPQAINTAGQCAHTLLHLSDSERKQRKAGKEGERNWYSLTDMLSAEATPTVLFGPRPLLLGCRKNAQPFPSWDLDVGRGKDVLILLDRKQNATRIFLE